MKKYLLIIPFMLLCHILFAAYLTNYPVRLKQPNGEVIQCYVTGDEYYRRIHDAKGYTIIHDSQTGYLVYAVLENDELVSSGFEVGKTDPQAVGLTAGADISAEKKRQIRNGFLDNPPARKALKESLLSLRADRNVGTLNNVVIFVRFSDDTEFTTPVSTYNDLFNKDEPGASMYRYFLDISHGKLHLPSALFPSQTGSVIVSYRDSQPRSYYQKFNAAGNPNGYNNRDEELGREYTLLKSAIEFVKNQLISSGLDLDFDNDNKVDNICFVVKGATDPWNGGLLWPHRTVLYSGNESPVSINGKDAYNYNLIIEDHLFNSSKGRQSVLVHETYHTLGAPDLYRYAGFSFRPVGPWDVMGDNTIPPQSSSAYVNHKYGRWTDGDIPEITISGNYTIRNVWSETNNCYKIASPNSESEFFMIEYRDKNVIYDSQLPGSGLIIYRINESIRGNASGPPDEIYVFRPGATNNTINGDIDNAYFSSQSGRTTFSDTSNPPCFLSDDSPGLGGIVISEIGSSGGETMSFKLTFPSPTKPVATQATDIERTGFTANWAKANGAISYLLSVYYLVNGVKTYTDGGFSDKPIGNVTAYKVENLDRNVSIQWYYTVKAVSGGIYSEASDEFAVQLENYDPVTCQYASHGQAEDMKEFLHVYPGTGPITGINSFLCSDYAEYYDLQGVRRIAGIKLDIADFANNSNDPAYAKITLKVWGVENGLPGAELYREDVPFGRLRSDENSIDFANPFFVSGPFFIGYQVYYSPVNQDEFGIFNASNWSTANRAFLKANGNWQAFNSGIYLNFNYATSLYVFPKFCSFVPGPDFSVTVPSDCDKLTLQFSNTSIASSETTWLWDFGDGKTSTDKNPRHTYSAPGNYTVKLLAENTVGKNEKTLPVTVAGNLQIHSTVKGISYQGASDGEIEITVEGGNSPYTIRWDDSQTTALRRENLTAGTYRITVTDAATCLSSLEIEVSLRTEIQWLGSVDTDWNNPSNWPGGRIPSTTETVILSGSSTHFPVLTQATTVGEIHFEPGAKIGGQHHLTSKAFVQYDLTRRSRWLMLSVPLQQVYPGDFTFGGYPLTWVRTFQATQSGSITKGSWVTLRGSTTAFGAGDGFVLWLDPDNGSGQGLQLLNGVRELPFFQYHDVSSPLKSFYEAVHLAHDYEQRTGSSTFYNVEYNGTEYVRVINDNYSVPREESAYRLAGETVSKVLDFEENAEAGGKVTLVGNPFMAALDFDQLHAANAGSIKNSYQVWTGTSYQAYAHTGYFGLIADYRSAANTEEAAVVNSLTKLIAPLQSFLVEKPENATTDALNFNASMTSMNSVVLHASAVETNKLNIIARNAAASVLAYIAKREGGRSDYGPMDVRKIINGFGNVPEVYTVKPKGEEFIAVGANIIDSDNLLIPIGLATSYTGEMTLSFTGMDNYDANLHLIDAAENREIDLTGLSAREYTFTYTPPKENGATAACQNRFFVRISKTPTGLAEVSATDPVNVYSSEGLIRVVSGPANRIREVLIYDLQGSLQHATGRLDAITCSIDKKLSAGVYIVRVIAEKSAQNVKLIIR